MIVTILTTAAAIATPIGAALAAIASVIAAYHAVQTRAMLKAHVNG